MSNDKLRGMCWVLAALVWFGLYSSPAVAMQSALTEDQITTLQAIAEEEKLARDVYRFYFSIDPADPELAVFGNIYIAEETHLATVQDMLLKWNLYDPTKDEAGETLPFGEFSNQAVKEVYDWMTANPSDIYDEYASIFEPTVVEFDPADETEAMLRVGGLIEEMDIGDLNWAIEGVDGDGETLVASLLKVYEDLQRGSRNHLRAFVHNLTQDGDLYVRVLLSEEEFMAIVTHAQEQGPYHD